METNPYGIKSKFKNETSEGIASVSPIGLGKGHLKIFTGHVSNFYLNQWRMCDPLELES